MSQSRFSLLNVFMNSYVKVKTHMMQRLFPFRNNHFMALCKRKQRGNNEETTKKQAFRLSLKMLNRENGITFQKRHVYDYYVTKMTADNCKSIVWFNCYKRLRYFDILLLRLLYIEQLCINNLQHLRQFGVKN